MTQNDKVIKYMQNYGRISQRDANQMGIGRLASRIWEIKKAGFSIITERERVKNNDQTTSVVAFYSLGGKS